MPADSSDCFKYFGYEDFRENASQLQGTDKCPIKDCSTKLIDIPYRKGEKPFCPADGIRLHSNTFVYWNGVERKDEARLRNFIIRQDLAREIALGVGAKAESHRLGYEMSEDALSWNVFVGLAEAGKLRHAVKFLTGRTIDVEPSLYLWGKLVDVKGRKPEPFPPLDEVRDALEKEIGNYKTEPDVMLVVEGRLVICVEAKFGSGNTLAHEGKVAEGEKPIERTELLRRYLDQASADTKRVIDRSAIGEIFHSQLFRNVVFASEMAKGCDWHVVNLVSNTQWVSGRKSKQYSFTDPQEVVQSYLADDYKQCFSFKTWEDLYEALIQGDTSLAPLNTYMRSKSAHYHRAFDLG